MLDSRSRRTRSATLARSRSKPPSATNAATLSPLLVTGRDLMLRAGRTNHQVTKRLAWWTGCGRALDVLWAVVDGWTVPREAGLAGHRPWVAARARTAARSSAGRRAAM